MDITIYQAMLPHDDPDATLAFYRDALGFELRNDVEYQGMHWITVGPSNQPETSIVLYPPAATATEPRIAKYQSNSDRVYPVIRLVKR